ncbi:hypothetical protein [Nocardioides convexus]|uniref:hypothetical protein n=1 Tax=Nocardioides convexus TaxID=2712224 RepID=UPI0024188163|nr:hypothetical protein [Nocardioides convexus]
MKSSPDGSRSTSASRRAAGAVGCSAASSSQPADQGVDVGEQRGVRARVGHGDIVAPGDR